MGAGWVAKRSQGSWKQVGLQGQNRSWRICWKVQSVSCGSRLFTEVWPGLWRDFLSCCKIGICRALIAFSVQQHLQLHQVYVTTAFLNGQLEEEVYTKQPDGFVAPGNEHLVCRLKKSIYGLKQSPCCWNSSLTVISKRWDSSKW